MNIRIAALACLIGFSFSLALDPRLEQGARFEAKGEYDMALGEYRSILAEDPKNADAYFAAAEVRVKMKDFSGALANYRLAYKFNPSMSAAYEGAAKVYEALNQKAKADAERAKDPKNKPAEEAVAEAAPAPVEEPKAAPEPVKAAEPAPEPAKVAEPAPAKAEPAKVAEPEPVKVSEPEPAKSAELPADPFERGKALLAEGKFKEAAPLWREVLTKKPGDAGAYFYAGLTRYEMGEFDKAEFNLKKGVSYKERGNDANYYLAQIYRKTGKLELEKKSLAAYLKKAAPDAQFRKEVGTSPIAKANIYFKAGSFEQALQMYRTVVESEAGPDERYFAMLQMGNIYRELRDFHSAVSRYREVVQQYPDSDWATEAERALEDAVWLEKHASELPRRTR